MASAGVGHHRLLPMMLLVSLSLHVLALRLLEPQPTRRLPAEVVELKMVEPAPPPAPTASPEQPKPAPPERPPKTLRHPNTKPMPVPNTTQPPTETPPRPVEPVAGVTQDSVVQDGASAVAVPVGNTLMAEPAKVPTPPEKVAALVPVDLASVSVEPRLLFKPTPQEVFGAEYPPEARAQNVQGLTRVKLYIDESGAVREVRAVKGPPLLRAAAEALAIRFRYSPAQQDGKPVAVWWVEDIPFRFND